MLFDFFAISESKSRAKSKGDQPLFDQSPVFFDECFTGQCISTSCFNRPQGESVNAGGTLHALPYRTVRTVPFVSRLLGPIMISKSPGSHTHSREWL